MSASARLAGAAFVLAGLTAAPAALAAPAPEATHVRLVGASLAVEGMPAAVDGSVLTSSLAFGATTAALPVSPGRHTFSVGSTSMDFNVAPGCTLNVVAAERGFRTEAALVPVPACGNGRIRAGASRVTVLVASDEPGLVRARLGDASAVEVGPFQVSAPLEPAAGRATLTLASAASGAVFASAESNLAAGTSTLVLFVGKGDQSFRLVPVFDGVQPQDPPSDVEINTGLPDAEGTMASLAALVALVGVLVARRRLRNVGPPCWRATTAAAVMAAVSLVGCSVAQLAGRPPEAGTPDSAPPARPSPTPSTTQSPAPAPPTPSPSLPPSPPPPAWGFNAPLPRSAPAPARVRVASLGVDAVVNTLPTSSAPQLFPVLPASDAAYLDGTFTPGTVGVSVIVGHRGVGGVFDRLAEARVGADVVVTDVEGVNRHFVILSRRTYTKGALPEELWTPDVGREAILVLVSCTGPRRSDGFSRDNVVVVARMV